MSANSFLSGFTGGMNAMNQMMDSAENRKYRQQAFNDEQVQRNALSMMHIYSEVKDDPEKMNTFNQGMFDTLNQIPEVHDLVNQEYPGAKLTGFEATAEGYVPMITYEKDGKSVTDAIRMDGKPMSISQQNLFSALGSRPELVSTSQMLGAQLIGAGGQAPEKPDQFETFTENGMRLKRNKKTGEEHLVGTVPKHAMPGAAGGGDAFPEYKSMGPVIELEDGRKVARYRVGNKVMEYTLDTNGDWSQPRDVTDKHFGMVSTQGSPTDRFNAGFTGFNPSQHVPFYELGNNQNQSGMEEKPAPKEKPKPKEKPAPKEKPKEEPVEKPKASTKPRSSVTGGYQRYQLSEEQEQRRQQANKEFQKQRRKDAEEAARKRAEQKKRQHEAMSNIRPGGM